MPKTPPPPPADPTSVTPPKMHLNWQDWLPLLEDEDIPEAEKRQLIETLWNIVVGFVDLGWGLNSGPEIDKEICGSDIDLTHVLNAAVLHSETQTETEET